MCKIKDNLSYIASTINADPGELSEAQLIERQTAANQAVAEHIAECAECQAEKRRYDAAVEKLIEWAQHDDGALLAGEVAQS